MSNSYDALIVVDTVATNLKASGSAATAYLVDDNVNDTFNQNTPTITCNKGDTVQVNIVGLLAGSQAIITGMANNGGNFPPMGFFMEEGAWQGTATQNGTETVTATIAIGGSFTPSGNNVTPNAYTFAFTLSVVPS